MSIPKEIWKHIEEKKSLSGGDTFMTRVDLDPIMKEAFRPW